MYCGDSDLAAAAGLHPQQLQQLGAAAPAAAAPGGGYSSCSNYSLYQLLQEELLPRIGYLPPLRKLQLTQVWWGRGYQLALATHAFA